MQRFELLRMAMAALELPFDGQSAWLAWISKDESVW